MVDTKRLRELANAATPGPWTSDMDMFNSDEGIVACVTNETVSLLAKLETGIVIPLADRWAESDSARRDQCWLDAHATQEQKDAAFIAAASPDVVLLLLDRIDALETACRKGDENERTDARAYCKLLDESVALKARVDALEAEKAAAMREGFEIAVDNADISEHDGWHRTDPRNDWTCAEKKLEERISTLRGVDK